ncbi:IS4 family transposase [Candidatus Parcubacteria bacterium]|nr:IS4 family transposase [Candidatus Parcubacteria bacterium]
MNIGKSIFAQLMEFIPHYEFSKCVKKYQGNYKVHKFACWEQFLCMAFAQLTYRESLRDIEACLRSAKQKLYHLGIKSKISRSTLANANERRDWRIYRDLGYSLIQRANKLYSGKDFAISLKNVVYALDATSIELCVSLFPWAAYCKKQAAIQMHTLLNLRGNIPSVIVITDKKFSERKILDELIIESGAIYILDRGYTDYARFYSIHQNQAYFLTRARINFSFKRLYSLKVDKTTGIQCDQIVCIKHYNCKKLFPDKLRRIKYTDLETGKHLVFLTNNMNLPAKTIADLYRSRWQIELFFKWIKQHLRIKAFYGRTENAVKTQIWIATSIYVLIAIVKKELKLELNLYTILQILSVSLFEKVPILQALSDFDCQRTSPDSQMSLF